MTIKFYSPLAICLFLMACSSTDAPPIDVETGTAAVQDNADAFGPDSFTTEDKPTKTIDTPWEAKDVLVKDPTTWPRNIIDKCTSEFCYTFKTPSGVYNLNDPRGLADVQSEISTAISNGGRPPSRKVFHEVRKQKRDMLRAGCKITVDAFCNNNVSRSHPSDEILSAAFKACKDDLNFGEYKLSDCVSSQLPQPEINPKTGKLYPLSPRKAIYTSLCPVGFNETRKPLNYLKFTGTIDEAVEATFDTRCIAWNKPD